MTAIFAMDFAKLNRASPEAKDRWSHRPNRGMILLKSGVIGFTVKRNPTWMTFPMIATTNTIASTGSAIFASQLMNALMRPRVEGVRRVPRSRGRT